MRRVPATVITGFLGAGKTSLVRHLLAHADGRRLAVVVNEFGELGIDRELLLGCGDRDCAEEDIVELTNGCLCCTVADDFLPAIETLLDRSIRPITSLSKLPAWRSQAVGQSLRVAGNPHPRHGRRRPRRDRWRAVSGGPFAADPEAVARRARRTRRSITTTRWRRCSRTSSPVPISSC